VNAAAAIGLGVVAAMLSIGSTTATAQDTRAADLERQRTEKAASLHPYEPSRVERLIFEIEDGRWTERLFNPPRGVFLRWGGLPEGAGVGAGPGVRYSNHTFSATATSVITARRYWEVDGRLAFPNLADRHLFAELGARRRDFPQEDFYGLGPDSADAARTSYAFRETSVDGLVGVKATSWLTLTGEVEALSPRVDSGRDPRVPSTEALFNPFTAPGLDVQPDFVRTGTELRIDYIDAPFGTGLGGRYTAGFDRFSDRDGGRYSFDRVQIDLQQYVPIVNNARLIALRGRFADLRSDAGRDVPFYLQPTLGGGYSLRGLPAYRLRDRSLLLMQAEYRWQVNMFIAGALFYDTGTVAARPRDLSLGKLSHDYGIGVRAGYQANAALRADLAFGDGGPRLVIKFSNVF
jgi:hypothetical protein